MHAPVIAVWPGAPAQALGHVLASVLNGSVKTVAPSAASGVLARGEADLALVPSLAALRTPSAFSLAPGAGLVGEQSPLRVLAISVPLDAIETVAFAPQWAQEALLTQLILRENFGRTASFRPVESDSDPAEMLSAHGAALVSPEAPLPEGTIVLDLGREWADLTSFPMVWGLVASRPDEMDGGLARTIAFATAAAGDPTGEAAYQFSLVGLGYNGLEAWADHLFYTGTLDTMPELPFVRAEEEPEGEVDVDAANSLFEPDLLPPAIDFIPPEADE